MCFFLWCGRIMRISLSGSSSLINAFPHRLLLFLPGGAAALPAPPSGTPMITLLRDVTLNHWFKIKYNRNLTCKCWLVIPNHVYVLTNFSKDQITRDVLISWMEQKKTISVTERSSITSSDFPKFWTPHLCHQDHWRPWPLPPPPNINDVILPSSDLPVGLIDQLKNEPSRDRSWAQQ